jgi:hypothetical protein
MRKEECYLQFNLVHNFNRRGQSASSDYCHNRRIGPLRLDLRIFNLTEEPFRIAASQNGANAAGIELLQKSIVSLNSPGPFRFLAIFISGKRTQIDEIVKIFIIQIKLLNLLTASKHKGKI